jgi:type I restriction enzyme S subunit
MKEYKLTEVCDFQGGTQPPKSEWINEPRKGYVRMLQIRDFTQGKAQHIEYVKDSNKVNKCKEDDILIARYGASIGKIVTGLEGTYNVALIKTIPNENLLTKKFLQSVLKSPVFQKFILSIGARAAQAGFNKEDLSRFKMFLPSLQDQIRIAEILTKAENLIKQRKESILLLDELLKSTFLEMFGDPVRNEKGWEIKTIEQLVKKEKYSIKRGPFGGALKKDIFVSEGYLVYEQYHALNNDFTFERYYINDEKFNELKAFEVFPNDIIISCSGVYLGKLAIIPQNAKRGIINQALLKIVLDQKIMSNHFFVFLFTHNSFKNKFFGEVRGSGVPNFPPIVEFKKFDFIYPPLDLQNKFVTIVEKVEALKIEYQANLTELENMYGVLSQKAFKGELKVKEYKNNEELGMVAETEGGY